MTTFVRRFDLPMDGAIVPMLSPDDKDSYENLKKCKKDIAYSVVLKRHNNPSFQRMVERMIRDLWENQEQFDSEAMHREYVKLQIGWVYETTVPSVPATRIHKAIEWIRGLIFNSKIIAPSGFDTGMEALIDLLESCTVQLVTKPLDFAHCDQDEREEFLELLKPYYADQLGEDAMRAYEGI